MLGKISAFSTRSGVALNKSSQMALGVATRCSSSTTLVVAEHDGSKITQGTLSTITAAAAMGGAIDVLCLGSGAGVAKAAANAATSKGVRKVLTVDSSSLANSVSEDTANAVLAVVKSGKYSHVFAPSTNNGKNYIPRAAALMDAAPLTDIISVLSPSKFKRPTYAGNAIATVEMSDAVKWILVRTTAFAKTEQGAGSAAVESVKLDESVIAAKKTAFVSTPPPKAAGGAAIVRPDLASARVVVSGGRGLKDGKNFEMLGTMADLLGGAVGASRAAVDAGYISNEHQVGQTGKAVAPELYLAVGISGAIQHLSGMKDSKTIVAINKDRDAPIFQVADYGLVADLFTAVPEINSKLGKK